MAVGVAGFEDDLPLTRESRDKHLQSRATAQGARERVTQRALSANVGRSSALVGTTAPFGGAAIVGDCLQNWARSDESFNLFARAVMPFMGFLRPHNVGPAWLKSTNPPKDDLRGIGGASEYGRRARRRPQRVLAHPRACTD
jgi:hypothetical protein